MYDLKNEKLDPVSLLDEFYTFMSNGRVKNRTIIGYLSIVKDYLNFHGMHIYTEDIKQKFRTPKPEVFYEEGLTKSILNRLLQNSVPKLRLGILLACSSGMRVGEIMQLKFSDIDFTTSPTTIKVRRETTKTRETRFTHITTETTKFLGDYITKKKQSKQSEYQYLFMNHHGEFGTKEYYKSMFSARQAMLEKLRLTIQNIPELSMKNENEKYRVHFHAFRKWFKQLVAAGEPVYLAILAIL